MKDRTATISMAPHPVDNVNEDAARHTVPLPSSEFLADFVNRISRTPDRVFTSASLRVALTMSARLTHDCAGANNQAYETWCANRTGTWHDREAREKAIREAHDFTDYVWDTAHQDATRAHRLLFRFTDRTVTTPELIKRCNTLTARTIKAVA